MRTKKLFIIVSILIGGMMSQLSQAAVPVQVPLSIINDGEICSGSTKTPDWPLVITQDENVLTLPVLEDDFVLELRDENNILIYSTFVPSGTTLVVLPTTLSGDFELRLVADTYYYYGYITL